MAQQLTFNRDLVKKYDRPGPRYTSYPTAPHFHPEFTAQQYRQAALESNHIGGGQRPLSVYIHIPFCKSLCYYCACNKIVTHKTERATEYLNYLKREITLQSGLFASDRKLTQLHLGGGTPTYLTHEQLSELMEALRENFNLDDSDDHEFSLEIDPRTITPEQVRQLRALGFNRLSFGIQDFDPAVQAAVNRVQSEAQIQSLVDAGREAEFKSISVDLIYGLPLQTVASFSQTLDKIIQLRPDRIATYSYAHLPHMVKAQTLIKPEDMPPPERKLELLEQTIGQLTAAGYVYIGMDHFSLPEDDLAQARAKGTLHRNFQGYSTHADCDLIGLGSTSIGKIGNSYSQNHKELKDYYAALNDSQLPIARGYQLSADDHLRRDVITDLMCHGRIDYAPIEARHGIRFREYFAEALQQLAEPIADGLVTIEDSAIILQPQGQLMMRNVAMAFDAYLGEKQQGRFSRTV